MENENPHKPSNSWKTSLIGCLTAAWFVIEPLLTNEGITYRDIIKAALIAAFGFLAKDFNKTGTNK